jgi:hypothetical protein
MIDVPAQQFSSRKNCGPTQPLQEDRLRTLVICALATSLAGCSSQPPTQQSCTGLNPLTCLTAVDVPIEPTSYDSDTALAKPASTAAWRDDRPVADRPIRRAPKPTKVAKAVPLPVPSPRAVQQTTGNAVTPGSARAITPDPDLPASRTTEQQVAAASAVAEGMSVPTPDASMDTLVAILVAGPGVESVSDLAGKTIAIDDKYSESSIGRIRTAIATAGALEVRVDKGQGTAVGRLVSREVPAAVVGLVSTSAADRFPELPRLRTFRVSLSPPSASKQP